MHSEIENGRLRGYAVILSKGFRGKTRLGLSKEVTRALQSALLEDIHAELERCGRFERVLVATPDAEMVEYCRSKGYITMALDSVDINASMQAICDYGIREGYDTMLVTASDLPFFSSKLVDSMLGHLKELLACNDSGAVFSPSRGLGMTVCCASPPASVHLFIDDRTPNFLLLDRVAGSTPRRLAFGIEGFLDIDRVDHLHETHQLMCEMPQYRKGKVFAFLEGWLSEAGNEGATGIRERTAPAMTQGAGSVWMASS